MYFDLCINFKNPNNQSLEKYQDLCELLTSGICDNYTVFAINTQIGGTLPNNELCKYSEIDLSAIYQQYSMKFLNLENPVFIDWGKIKQLKRLTVEVSDSKDLFQFSNPNNSLKSYDIIAIMPKNEKMFDVCCGELNIDIITLNFEEKMNYSLKKHMIISAIDKNVYFEVIYSNFVKDTTRRGVFISNLIMLFEVTKGKNIIFSSGADNYFDHRSPYDIMTIFETIFKIKKDALKKMVSDTCEKVVNKSLQRKYFKTVINLEIEDKISKNGEEYNTTNTYINTSAMQIDVLKK